MLRKLLAKLFKPVKNITDAAIAWTDSLRVVDSVQTGTGTGTLTRDVPFDAIHTRIMNDPSGVQEVRLDQTFDLTGLAATFKLLFTVPAGAIIDQVSLYITSTIAGTGNLAKLAIGAHGGTTNTWGAVATLTAGSHSEKMIASSVLGGSTAVELCGVTSDGSTITTGTITSGAVHATITYRIANALTA